MPYGPPFYPDRPRQHGTAGHAQRALEDLLVRGKLVRGGTPSQTSEDFHLSRLRNTWPNRYQARQQRDAVSAKAATAAERCMLMSQLMQTRAQMPAWGHNPAHMSDHREYILKALRHLGGLTDREVAMLGPEPRHTPRPAAARQQPRAPTQPTTPERTPARTPSRQFSSLKKPVSN